MPALTVSQEVALGAVQPGGSSLGSLVMASAEAGWPSSVANVAVTVCEPACNEALICPAGASTGDTLSLVVAW